MGVIRWTVVLWVALTLPAISQSEAPISRPSFQHAMGLLRTEPFRIDAPGVSFEALLPMTDEVQARINPEAEASLALVEFAGPGNTFLETVLFASAKVAAGTATERAFGLANLLVLRTFPRLKETFPDAQILGFSPLTVGDTPAVQVVGTYTHDKLGPAVFRHVGLMPEGRDDVLLALISVSAVRMPARNAAELENTYSGWMLRQVTFDDLPAAD